MELTDFIKARLDEDEAIARSAGGKVQGGHCWRQVDAGRSPGLIGDELGNVVVYDEGMPICEQAEHIARHDPARALREVAAKRKILWDHTPKTTGRRTACSRCHYGNVLGANWPCLTMTSLAGIWSDHPDFHPQWTP
jgi:hypothetical protein